MSDVKNIPHWMEGMMEMQQKYWGNVSTMLQSVATPRPTKKSAPAQQAPKHHPFHEHLDSWSKVSEHCHHLASMAALYPKSAFHAEAPKVPSYSEAFAFGAVENFASLPAIGPSRESIEMLQQWQPLLSDYAAAWQAYQPILAELGIKAWKLTLIKLAELINCGHTLTTRQIYDVWIECGEQTYAEIVKTEDYQKIYGQLTNVSMACKQHLQAMRQEMLGSLNLPTKQDLNSAYERIHKLGRESKEQKKAIAYLQREMQELVALSAAQTKKTTKPKRIRASTRSKEGKNAPRKK